MEKKKLDMVFLSEGKKKFTLSLDSPKSDLEAEDVEKAMNSIITGNIFAQEWADLKEIDRARLVTTTTETII